MVRLPIGFSDSFAISSSLALLASVTGFWLSGATAPWSGCACAGAETARQAATRVASLSFRLSAIAFTLAGHLRSCCARSMLRAYFRCACRHRESDSVLKLDLDVAFAHRRLQRCMVLLGLIGIAERKPAHRLVEFVPLAEIAADCPGIAGLRMRPRQNPAARLGVDRQHLGVIGLDQRRELHVAQLAQIEMLALRPGDP